MTIVGHPWALALKKTFRARTMVRLRHATIRRPDWPDSQGRAPSAFRVAEAQKWSKRSESGSGYPIIHNGRILRVGTWKRIFLILSCFFPFVVTQGAVIIGLTVRSWF